MTKIRREHESNKVKKQDDISLVNTNTLPTVDLDFQIRSIKEAEKQHQRNLMTGLFQAHELTRISAPLTRGETYTVVLSQPVRGTLNARTDGMLDAFVKEKDGKIIAVARLKQAGSALLTSAAALSGYAMLVQISTQLKGVRANIEELLCRLDAAKRGKVDSALKMLKHTKDFDPEDQRPLLRNAIGTLGQELAASHDVKGVIDKIPEPQATIVGRVVWGNADTERALDRAEASARAALLCLTALGQAHLCLNEVEGAAKIMASWIRDTLDLPLAQAEFLARRLPGITTEEERRDRFWIDVRHALERALEKVEDALDPDRPTFVRFAVSGAELTDSLVRPKRDAVPAAAAEATPASLRADPTTHRR